MTTPRYDSDISTDARSYIQSLHEPLARDNAREYARMDDQSFRARMGPGVDALTGQLGILIKTQQDTLKAQIELRDSLRSARHLPVSRRMLAGFAVFGGAFADILLSAITSIAHNIHLWKP